jgi:hypothetical protein
MRVVYEALLPPGAIWIVEHDAGFDRLIAALASNAVDIKDYLAKLSTIRSPRYTEFLTELEQEFGIIPNFNLSEELRRENLGIAKTQRGSLKNADYLEQILRGVGFDVYVHINNPPVNPNQFLFEAFNIYSGGENAYSGNENAVSGGVGGELVVNGDLVIETSVFSCLSGGDFSVSGGKRALAGKKDFIKSDPVVYDIPSDPGYWGLFFFVGGPATRNPSGEITAIATAEIPVFRRSEFRRLILQLKPLHTWAGVIVKYVAE